MTWRVYVPPTKVRIDNHDGTWREITAIVETYPLNPGAAMTIDPDHIPTRCGWIHDTLGQCVDHRTHNGHHSYRVTPDLEPRGPRSSDEPRPEGLKAS